MHAAASRSKATSHIKRRLTREQLLESLRILGTLDPPLPPELPTFLPHSRSDSPPPSHKRHIDADEADDRQKKKARVNSATKPPPPRPQQPSAPQPSASTSYLLPHLPEEGEVEADRPLSATVSSYIPVRRPRRGKLPRTYYDDVYNKIYPQARKLKISGEARLWSMLHPTQFGYRPLKNPPPANSPYHKYGALFGRLELLDAIIRFAYSLWVKSKDPSRPSSGEWNMESMFTYVKKWWCNEELDEREKPFLGLIQLLEGFVYARKVLIKNKEVQESNQRTRRKLDIKYAGELKRMAAEAAAANPPATAAASLPSPAMSNSTSSASSTPLAKQEEKPALAPEASHAGPSQRAPAKDKEDNLPPRHIVVSVDAHFVQDRLELGSATLVSHEALRKSERTLTLPTLAKHFPRTFARVLHTGLSSTDELEPDFDDEEGELFWPGQAMSGDGLGWVCLMGRSMINEFSKRYGYLGHEGALELPDEEQRESATPIPGSPEDATVAPEPAVELTGSAR